MVPMAFTVTRDIDGAVITFWRGQVVEIDLDALEAF